MTLLEPGFHVDPRRLRLSEKWESDGNAPLDATLLRKQPHELVISIDGRQPVRAWLHDDHLLDQFFRWFSEHGLAKYDYRHGLLKVWAGTYFAVICPKIIA